MTSTLSSISTAPNTRDVRVPQQTDTLGSDTDILSEGNLPQILSLEKEMEPIGRMKEKILLQFGAAFKLLRSEAIGETIDYLLQARADVQSRFELTYLAKLADEAFEFGPIARGQYTQWVPANLRDPLPTDLFQDLHPPHREMVELNLAQSSKVGIRTVVLPADCWGASPCILSQVFPLVIHRQIWRDPAEDPDAAIQANSIVISVNFLSAQGIASFERELTRQLNTIVQQLLAEGVEPGQASRFDEGRLEEAFVPTTSPQIQRAELRVSATEKPKPSLLVESQSPSMSSPKESAYEAEKRIQEISERLRREGKIL